MTGTGTVEGMGVSWVIGACWFYCGETRLVLCVGTVMTSPPTRQAPLYACGPCLNVLEGAVEDYTEAAAHLPVDEQGAEVRLYASPEAGRPRGVRYRAGGLHRRPRTGLGRQWWGLITGLTKPRPSAAEIPPSPGGGAVPATAGGRASGECG